MRPIGSHSANGPHAAQQRRDGASAQGGQRQGPAAAAPAPRDTFERQGTPATYQQVSGALGRDPAAQQALQGMLAKGQLSGPLLGQLGRLAQPGGDIALLGQVVRDVSNPGSIRQGKDNEFCAATTALSDLAASNPAEYARLAADLELDGHSRTANGKAIRAQGAGPEGMSPTQRLLAPAITEEANGGQYKVDDKGVSRANDKKNAPRDTPRLKGLWASGMERMQQMLQGKTYRSLYVPGKGEHGRGKAVHQAEGAIARSVASGEQPSVSQGGHWYRITGQGGGQLTLQDQQSGQARTVNASKFLGSAEAVTFAAASGQVSREFRDRSKDEQPGGGGSAKGTLTPVEDARVR